MGPLFLINFLESVVPLSYRAVGVGQHLRPSLSLLTQVVHRNKVLQSLRPRLLGTDTHTDTHTTPSCWTHTHTCTHRENTSLLDVHTHTHTEHLLAGHMHARTHTQLCGFLLRPVLTKRLYLVSSHRHLCAPDENPETEKMPAHTFWYLCLFIMLLLTPQPCVGILPHAGRSTPVSVLITWVSEEQNATVWLCGSSGLF